MTTPSISKRPTIRQLEAAAATLLAVYELPTTSERDRESISHTRDLLSTPMWKTCIR